MIKLSALAAVIYTRVDDYYKCSMKTLELQIEHTNCLYKHEYFAQKYVQALVTIIIIIITVIMKVTIIVRISVQLACGKMQKFVI